MTENKFTGMLHAYALGCLNPGDYTGLLNYFGTGEDYPYQDLGEFQNLVALLPSIIESEHPPKSVKENIAKQLYYIKDIDKEKKGSPPKVSEVLIDRNENVIEEEPEEAITEMQEEPLTPEIPVEQEEKIDFYKSPVEEPVGKLPQEEQKTVVEEEQVSEPELISEIKTVEAVPEVAEEPSVEELQEIPVQDEIKEAPVEEVVEIHEEELPAAPEIIQEETQPETVTASEEKETKPARSLGEFFAGADVKPEEITGKIEFEDYFAEARKAEIQKRQAVRHKVPSPPVTETIQKEKPLKISPVMRSEDRGYRRGPDISMKIFIAVLIIAGAAGLYYYFNSELQLFKTDNQKMSEELESLRSLNTQNKEVLSILSMKDCRLFNLYGSSENQYSYGKVIYSPAGRKGVIFASSLPEVKERMSYQFWINLEGRNFLIHKFTSATVQEFYTFSLQRFNFNQSLRVFLTEEPFTGSDTPSRNVLLSGTN